MRWVTCHQTACPGWLTTGDTGTAVSQDDHCTGDTARGWLSPGQQWSWCSFQFWWRALIRLPWPPVIADIHLPRLLSLQSDNGSYVCHWSGPPSQCGEGPLPNPPLSVSLSLPLCLSHFTEFPSTELRGQSRPAPALPARALKCETWTHLIQMIPHHTSVKMIHSELILILNHKKNTFFSHS